MYVLTYLATIVASDWCVEHNYVIESWLCAYVCYGNMCGVSHVLVEAYITRFKLSHQPSLA